MSSPTDAYYRGALAVLHFVEARKPTQRRFGADADALWKGFSGDLTTADRIDLLLRDADTQWPGAFGPRSVFGLEGVAEDEPSGPDWQPLDPVEAEQVWREWGKAATPKDLASTVAAIGKAWGLRLEKFAMPPVAAADQLVAAGPSAISALVRAFDGRQDLDWSQQVMCVATPSGHRHLAVAAGALLNLTKPSRVTTATAPTTSAVKVKAGAKLVVSSDADVEDAAHARALVAL